MNSPEGTEEQGLSRNEVSLNDVFHQGSLNEVSDEVSDEVSLNEEAEASTEGTTSAETCDKSLVAEEMRDEQKSDEPSWDCIVIGAGPAGSIAAREVALAGYKVLLVDKDDFPRYKVCGCCINGSAQNALVEAGLPDLLEQCNAVSLQELTLFEKDRRASIDLPSGKSLSRSRFDHTLIEAAVDSGVELLANTTAKVLNQADRRERIAVRQVSLEGRSITAIAEAAVVVVAEGLAGKSLDRHREFKSSIKDDSRFGAGVVLENGPAFYQAGRIYMACGSGGYVGLVRLEDGRLDIAAAFDQSFSRNAHGPARAAAQILNQCSLPVPEEIETAHWTGTQLLTRSRERIGAERLLVIGDACGYPEPFTGEGIAWALWSGLLGGRIAARGIQNWEANLLQEWVDVNRNFRRQQSRSKLIASGLRNDIVRRFSLKLLARNPRLASYVVRSINDTKFDLSSISAAEMVSK